MHYFRKHIKNKVLWPLSILWIMAGFVGTFYYFYNSTKPYTWSDDELGLVGWSSDIVAIKFVVILVTVVLVVLPIPVVIAGFIRLRGWRSGNRFRCVVWVGTWIAGVPLMYVADYWGQYPGSSPKIGSPAVLSWGELAICAAWLAMGAVLTWVLARHSRGSDASTFRNASLRPDSPRGPSTGIPPVA
jgi:hypothetical protein